MFVNVTSKFNFSLYRSKKKEKKDFKWQWLIMPLSHYDFDLIDEEKLSVELYFFNEFSMLYCKITLKIWIEL